MAFESIMLQLLLMYKTLDGRPQHQPITKVVYARLRGPTGSFAGLQALGTKFDFPASAAWSNSHVIKAIGR